MAWRTISRDEAKTNVQAQQQAPKKEVLAYINAEVKNLAKNDPVIDARAKAVLGLCLEVMDKIEQAGLTTQSLDKNKNPYTDKLVVKVTPDSNDPKKYWTTAEYKHGTTTLILYARDDVSNGAQFSAMGVKKWDKDIGRSVYFKQNEIASAPIYKSIKDIAKFIEDNGYIQKKAMTVEKQATEKPAVEKPAAPAANAPARTPARTSSWGQKKVPENAPEKAPKDNPAKSVPQAAPQNTSDNAQGKTFKKSILREFSIEANKFFDENSAKVPNNVGKMVNDVYARYTNDKYGEKVTIFNHHENVIVELRIVNGERHAVVKDFELNEQGKVRREGEKPMVNEIVTVDDIDAYISSIFPEIKEVVYQFKFSEDAKEQTKTKKAPEIER